MRVGLPWLLVLVLLAGCGGGGVRATGPDGPDDDPQPDPPVVTVRRLDTDLAGAALSFAPQLGVVDDDVHVAWSDRRSGRMDVHYNRSADGGASWLAQDVRLDADGAGFATSAAPRLAVSGQTVFVAWHDDRAGPNDIRFNRSLDGGRTWLSVDRRIDTDGLGAANSRDPDVVVDGLRVFVVWRDQRDGSFGIHFNRSLDAGDTWLANDVRIDGGLPGVTTAGSPRIVRVGDRLHVVWSDDRLGGADVHLATSHDAGANWDPALRISRPPTGPAQAGSPLVAAEGQAVVVAYDDVRSGVSQVFANASADAGATWLPSDVRVNRGAGQAEAPHLALADGIAHLVWEDGGGGSDDVRYSRSPDGGRTWLATDTRLDLTTDVTAFAGRPRLAVRGLNLVACWLDNRSGVLDVLVRRSLDGGLSWGLEQGPLDQDDSGLGESLDARIALTAAGAVVVWSDTRSGQADIFANHVRDGESATR